MYDNNKINFQYEKRMEYGMNLLKNKEKTSHVKVSEYILKHYKYKRLFQMPNHPSYDIIKEMSKQILEKLQIDYSNFDELTENDNVNLGCDWEFSKYDKSFHNFEFQMNCNDDAIKNIIIEIYNLY